MDGAAPVKKAYAAGVVTGVAIVIGINQAVYHYLVYVVHKKGRRDATPT
jgi:hypothetical protein